MDLKEFFSDLGPTLVGLAALLVTWRLAVRQIRAATVSASRQQWINSLHDALAELLAAISTIGVISKDSPITTRVCGPIFLNRDKVSLMLNRDNPKHKALLDAIQDYLRVNMNRENGTAGIREELVAAAQAVMDAEWTKIKRGK